MPKNGNPKNKMVKTSYPIIKVDLSSKVDPIVRTARGLN